jgi:hypothetical protein
LHPSYYEPKTLKGLKYLNYGWILYIIGLIILLIVLLAILPTLSDLMSDPENVEEEDLGPLFALIGGMCLAILILFIMMILFLVGLVHLLSGRDEFGPEHSSRAMMGFIFILMGFVISFFGGIGGFYIGTGVSIASNIMYGLGFVFLVEKLLDERQKNILWAGGIIYIIIGIIAAIINLWLVTTLDLNMDNPEEAGSEFSSAFSSFMIISMGLMAMYLLPIILFLVSYRAAEERIRSGELQPIMPAYPPPPAYGAYYPPPPGAGAPPPGYPPPHGYPPPQSETPSKCPSCEAKIYYKDSKRCHNCGFYFG